MTEGNKTISNDADLWRVFNDIFSKTVGDLKIPLRSVFEDFNEATDRLDNFWFEKAKISHFKILAFVVKLILSLFHG